MLFLNHHIQIVLSNSYVQHACDIISELFRK